LEEVLRLATIDIGTNSTRLLISEIRDGEIIPLFKTGKVTRLGQGLRESKVLSKESISRTIKVLKEFKEIISKYNVDKITAVATEATRLAENSEEFLNKVRELGIDIKILSDREEAELVFLANVYHFNPSGYAVTVDLGGGSTEIVYGTKERIEFLKSLKFGVVFLYEEFLHSDPPAEKELLKLEEFISENLLEVKGEIRDLNFETFAVGGTITSVVAMEEKMEVYRPEVVHGYRVSKEVIDKWYKKLSSMTLEERKNVVGLEENRADVIIPGLAFFKVFCDVFEKEYLTVSELGLLYSLALKEAKNWKRE
jgi:exopolyphosphatase/guanosine-5'-triphosphate,3'-diphosphate pyrophosphatase